MYKTVIFDYGNTLCDVGSLAHCLSSVCNSEKADDIGEVIEQKIVSLYRPDQREQPDWKTVWSDAFAQYDEPFHEAVGIEHLRAFCRSGTLYEYTLPILKALKNKGVKVVLLSNATGPEAVFQEDFDHRGLTPYFDHVIWSSDIGYRKPYCKAYEITLEMAGANAGESLMVGDNEIADIVGGRSAGLDTFRVCDHPPENTQATRHSTRDRFYEALLPLFR